MQHHVHAGGRAGRGEDAAGVHIQHVGAHLNTREAAGEQIGEPPVGGSAETIQQAGMGEHKCTRANRCQPRAACVGRTQFVQQGRWWAFVGIAPAGNHDHVRVVKPVERGGRLQLAAT